MFQADHVIEIVSPRLIAVRMLNFGSCQSHNYEFCGPLVESYLSDDSKFYVFLLTFRVSLVLQLHKLFMLQTIFKLH